MRWTPKRKAEIVEQALKDPQNVAELLAKHNITTIELSSWCERLMNHGIAALRATHVQEYRRAA